MKIRKSYEKVNPELLFAEVRDFVLKQGAVLSEQKLETFALPGDSSTFISRGILSFRMPDRKDKECLRAHVVGTARGETKLMLDIDEQLFAQEKVAATEEDLDFIFGANEIKQKQG